MPFGWARPALIVYLGGVLDFALWSNTKTEFVAKLAAYSSGFCAFAARSPPSGCSRDASAGAAREQAPAASASAAMATGMGENAVRIGVPSSGGDRRMAIV